MSTRTVVHDGHHDAEIRSFARMHGAVHVHRNEDGSWTIIDGAGGVHALPLGASLVCTQTRRRRFFSVHEPVPQEPCRLVIRRDEQEPCRLVIRRDEQGLWRGWIQADQLPGGGQEFIWAYTWKRAIRSANSLLTEWQEGWRPLAWDEGRSPQRMQVLPPERAEVPA